MKITILKNSHGMTLVETTIAMGVGLIATLALTTMVANTSKDADRARRAVETSGKQAIALELLSNSETCADRIQVINPNQPLVEKTPQGINLIQKIQGFPDKTVIKNNGLDGVSLMGVNLVPTQKLSTSGTVEKWVSDIEIVSSRNTVNANHEIVASDSDMAIKRRVPLYLNWDTSSKKIVACSTTDPNVGSSSDPFKNKFVVFGQCAAGSCTIPFTYAFTSQPKVFLAPSVYNITSRMNSAINYTVTTRQLVVTMTGGYSRVNYLVIGDAKDDQGNAVTSGLALDAGTLPVTNDHGANSGTKWFQVPFASRPFVFVWGNGTSWSDGCSNSCDSEAPTLHADAVVPSDGVTTGSFNYTVTARDDDGAPKLQGISYIAVGPLVDGAQINFPTPDAVEVSVGSTIPWTDRLVTTNFSKPYSNPPKVLAAITGYNRAINCGNSSGQMAAKFDAGVSGASVTLSGNNGCSKHQVTGANLLVLGGI